MRILSNSAKFSAGRPLLPAYNFRPQWPLPIALIVWGVVSDIAILVLKREVKLQLTIVWGLWPP